jgi:hypothetical protein
LTGKGTKLITVALVGVILVSVFGYWLLAPKTQNQVLTFTTLGTQETSLSISSEETSTMPTSSVGMISTTLSSATTLWINITATRSVSYYLGLLELNRTEPYAQLARELHKLPDLRNATAVAKITYLALNATNPEVKEAFQLMMKGGTPTTSDFKYTVPNYNTELEVLYWLATSTQFKRDDTLALATAMSNGFWVTVGDEQVTQTVKVDASNILTFLRETNEMQYQRGYRQLEQYPLEAKLLLTWLGPTNNLCSWAAHRLQDYAAKRVNLHDYQWNVVSVSTLKAMRAEMNRTHWISADSNAVVANLERYFWFTGDRITLPHWDYVCYGHGCSSPTTETVMIDGEKVLPVGFRNMNWLFQYYLQTGRGIGGCIDEAPFIRTWLLSWGISANNVDIENKEVGHTYAIYFDPAANSSKAYPGQLISGAGTKASFSLATDFYVFKPPVQQHGYFNVAGYGPSGAPYFRVSDHIIKGTTLATIMEVLSSGVSSSEMKQWLLYS